MRRATFPEIYLWEPGLKQPAVLRGHWVEIRDVTFSPDGKRLASCGIDGSAQIWDVDEALAAAAQHPDEKLAVEVVDAGPAP